MPSYAEDLKKIEGLRKSQSEATKAYGSLTSSAQTFGDEVMAKVRAARAERGTSMLASGMGEASSQLATEPAKIRARTADVNPMSVDAITAQQRGQTLGTLATLGQLEAEQTGSMQDIIGAETNKILAQATAKKAESEAAAQEAQSVIEALQMKQTQQAQAFDQWYKQQQLTGAGAGEEESNLKYLASQYKPTGGQEELANKAIIGVGLIKDVRGIIKDNPDALREAAGFWSFLNPQSRALKKNLEFISDTITRIQTGAALNEDEQKFYNNFLSNPTEAILGYTAGAEKSMDILEKVFNLAIEQTKNPYLDILEKKYSSQYGWDTGSKNHRVVDPNTGAIYETENEEEYRDALMKGYIEL